MQPPHRAPRSLSSVHSTFTAQTFSAPGTSTEALALAYVLRHIDPSELHARLLHSVTNASTLLCSSDTLKNIFRAFEELGVGPTARARVVVEGAEANIERHCVRCHNPYFEKDNGPEECNIPHDLATQVEMRDPVTKKLTGRVGHYYTCCEIVLPTHDALESMPRHIDERDGKEKGGRWCSQGRHTTHRAAVRYNGTNIAECWTKACEGAPVPEEGEGVWIGDEESEDESMDGGTS
ncbi:hypothetical protein FA13DRAFT_198286 [Coprinellus micaceus]|jgi:hypothetical protein|uniref:Uncharacterized protein n=1 Tax=Coprinellus micaceus TaxID=71717 RepID=A0A4Y7TGH4_COPMI|nr:hypothetical protein FA13DRAFT_198286 [Coprinellus micaceus]